MSLDYLSTRKLQGNVDYINTILIFVCSRLFPLHSNLLRFLPPIFSIPLFCVSCITSCVPLERITRISRVLAIAFADLLCRRLAFAPRLVLPANRSSAFFTYPHLADKPFAIGGEANT